MRPVRHFAQAASCSKGASSCPASAGSLWQPFWLAWSAAKGATAVYSCSSPSSRPLRQPLAAGLSPRDRGHHGNGPRPSRPESPPNPLSGPRGPRQSPRHRGAAGHRISFGVSSRARCPPSNPNRPPSRPDAAGGLVADAHRAIQQLPRAIPLIGVAAGTHGL